MRLRLSAQVTFHARGEAVYSFHGETGDVCEMSRDVAALCLAFERPARVEEVLARRPGGLDPDRAEGMCRILQERLILHRADENEADRARRLGRRRPYVPRFAIYERRGRDAVVYGRSAALAIAGAAPLLDAADGTRALAELLPPPRFASLLRLCAPDFAALKLLPEGAGIPAWAESTMPWPARPLRDLVEGRAANAPADLAAYHAAIADAEAQFDEVETTLSHLFRDPHPALGGERFGERLASVLVARGALPSGARVVEVGGGLGYLGAALASRLSPRSYLVVDRSPALAAAQRRRGLESVVGDALRLPLGDGCADLLVSNEMAGDLGSDETGNHGALALVGEAARVLAPGGLAYLSEFGHPTRAPVRSDHLDHDEYSIRFGDLRARARALGLDAELVPLPRLLDLDGAPEALSTTRASFAALRLLFRAHGGDLAKRAWLLDELREAAARVAIDLDAVHGIVVAPLGERTMGLSPRDFWAILARRPS